MSINRRNTTLTMDIGNAVIVYGSDTESMDAEMSQGEPKRVCTDEMVAPRTEQSPNTLQLGETAIETVEDKVNMVAESATDGSLEISTAT